jgi:hypothetical protein
MSYRTHFVRSCLAYLTLCSLLVAALAPGVAHGASLVVTNNLDSGAGSLRAAIVTANTNGQADTITFAVAPVYSTIMGGHLPPITESNLTIDATGTPAVINAGAFEAFMFNAVTGCTIRNLTVAGAKYAVRVVGGSGHIIENMTLTSNTFAVRMENTSSNVLRGSTIYSNSNNAVTLVGASSNTIGGNTPGQINRIYGHATGAAIQIDQITTPSVITSSNNIITGNRLGLNFAGTAAQANLYGIHITSGPGTRIGGTATGEANIISGNTYGVRLRGATTINCLVQGNLIGVAEDGTSIIPNSFYGVSVESSSNRNTIGGPTAAHSNVIKGNGLSGIFITGAAANRNTIQRNSIFQNSTSGISLASSANGSIAAPVLQFPSPLTGTVGVGGTLQLYVDNAAQGETWVQEQTGITAGTLNVITSLAAYEGKNLTATITDSIGNTSAFSAPIFIDVTPPTGGLAVDDPIVIDENVLLLVDSPVDTYTPTANIDMRFSNDGTTWSAWEPYAATKAWLLPDTGPGLRTVSVQYLDDSNNTSASYTATVEVDNDPPTGGLLLPSPVYTTPLVTIDVDTPADNNSAPAAIEMRFSNDGGTTWSAWELFAATKAWDLNQDLLDTSDGARTVSMQLRDEAGNVSTTYSAGTELDTTGPVVTGITLLDPVVSDLTSVRYEISFDEPLLNFDTGVNLATDDIGLTVTGLVDTFMSEVVANGLNTYTVVLDTGTGDGTIILDLLAGGFTDDHGNPFIDAQSAAPYVIDRLAITLDPVGGAPIEDDPFSFSVATSGGLGTLHYAWLKDGNPIPDAQDAPIYNIPVLVLSDSGSYSCVVSDDYVDVTSDAAQLDVQIRIPVASGAGLALLSGLLATGFAFAARRKNNKQDK